MTKSVDAVTLNCKLNLKKNCKWDNPNNVFFSAKTISQKNQKCVEFISFNKRNAKLMEIIS